MHHIHLLVPNPAEAQKWYVQHFGAIAGKRIGGIGLVRSEFDTVNVPGTEITLSKVDGAVRNSANALELRIVYITDPWGTKIEITQGLAGPPVARR